MSSSSTPCLRADSEMRRAEQQHRGLALRIRAAARNAAAKLAAARATAEYNVYFGRGRDRFDVRANLLVEIAVVDQHAAVLLRELLTEQTQHERQNTYDCFSRM